MEGALEPFSRETEHLQLKPPTIPCISNVTGAWLSDEQAMDPSYWVQQLRRPVRFSQGLEHLLRMQGAILLEVGPGQTLSALAKRHPEMTARRLVLSSLRRPDEQEHDHASVLKALGRLWLSGAEINWSGFYANERRRRLALPTYPFERQRHWVDLQPLQGRLDENPGSDQQAVRKIADKEDWLYLPSWKRSVIPAGAENLDPDDRRRWLLFLDDVGLGAELARKLKQEGREVITVSAGARFSRLDADDYEICPRNKKDYEALIRELITDDKLPRVIIHQWGVTTPEDLESADETADETLIQSQYRGFYSLLYLAQALAGQAPAEAITIQVVTNNIHEVIGQEAVCAEKSTVLGLCKVIPQEYPNITCRSIDILPAGEKGAPDSALVRHLAAEVTVASSDLVVAYRGNHRWVQSFEPLALKEGGGSVPRLRVNGVYLITGGLGLIGLALCEYLAQTLQARLVLTGRSAFPPEREWEQWLATHDAEDEVSRKIRRLKSVEGMGGEVMVMRADVSKEEEMRSVIEEAGRRYGGINGVIHAAGIVGDASIRSVSETDESDYEWQLSPKAQGAIALERMLRDQEIDFVLLMSSLSTVLGGLGYAAYSAANHYLDAFVHMQNRASKFPWISVNWDGWRFEATRQDLAGRRDATPKLGLTPQDGTELFRLILSMSNVSQVVISTANLQARINQWVNLQPLRDERPSERDSAGSGYTRQNFQNGFVAPRSEIEGIIAGIWQELLGVNPVGVEDNFFELGGHSLLAIQMISRIREALRIEVPMRNLFEVPTIAGLAQSIEMIRWATNDKRAPADASAGDFQELEI
jgi:acyl transferase domain-containing protein/acyl carrier protein